MLRDKGLEREGAGEGPHTLSRHGAIQSGAFQSGAIQSGAIQSGAIQRGAIQSMSGGPRKGTPAQRCDPVRRQLTQCMHARSHSCLAPEVSAPYHEVSAPTTPHHTPTTSVHRTPTTSVRYITLYHISTSHTPHPPPPNPKPSRPHDLPFVLHVPCTKPQPRSSYPASNVHGQQT